MFGLNRKNFAIMDATVGDHASIADLHGLNFARGWTTSEIDKLAEQSNTFVLVARTVGEPDAPVLGFNIVRHTPHEGGSDAGEEAKEEVKEEFEEEAKEEVND